MVYQLHSPTLGILTEGDGRRIPITIPADGRVTVVRGDVLKDRLLDVIWDGQVIMVFAVDVQSRGEIVRSAGA
jgi:hypothetical protein